MPRESYQERLEELREDVLYMSEVVLERFRLGLDALEQKDEGLAWEVIEGDDEINRMYLELEQDCVDLLALQQPVAGDLRFIAASFKIITDLERVADLATNLGEYTLDADEIDRLCAEASEAVVRDLIEREVGETADEDTIEQLMNDVSRLLLTIRDLERVGDHAVNVSARTLYMVENDADLIY